jgi:hypothetical protein
MNKVNHLKRIEAAPLFCCLGETPFGPVALIWKLCGKESDSRKTGVF